jgi:hypothetical protein
MKVSTTFRLILVAIAVIASTAFFVDSWIAKHYPAARRPDETDIYLKHLYDACGEFKGRYPDVYQQCVDRWQKEHDDYYHHHPLPGFAAG